MTVLASNTYYEARLCLTLPILLIFLLRIKCISLHFIVQVSHPCGPEGKNKCLYTLIFKILREKQEDNAQQGVNKQFIKGGTKGRKTREK